MWLYGYMAINDPMTEGISWAPSQVPESAPDLTSSDWIPLSLEIPRTSHVRAEVQSYVTHSNKSRVESCWELPRTLTFYLSHFNAVEASSLLRLYFNVLESIHFEGQWMLAPRAQEPGGRRCLEAWLIISQQLQGRLTASSQPMRGVYIRHGPIIAHQSSAVHSLVWWWRGPRHWMGLATEFMGWLCVMPGAADSGSCILQKYFCGPASGCISTGHSPSWDAWGPGGDNVHADETLIFRSAPDMQLATLLSSGLSTSCPAQAVSCTFSKFQSATNNYQRRPPSSLSISGQLLRLQKKTSNKIQYFTFTSPLTITVSPLYFSFPSPISFTTRDPTW